MDIGEPGPGQAGPDNNQFDRGKTQNKEVGYLEFFKGSDQFEKLKAKASAKLPEKPQALKDNKNWLESLAEKIAANYDQVAQAAGVDVHHRVQWLNVVNLAKGILKRKVEPLVVRELPKKGCVFITDKGDSAYELEAYNPENGQGRMRVYKKNREDEEIYVDIEPNQTIELMGGNKSFIIKDRTHGEGKEIYPLAMMVVSPKENN